MMHDLGTHRAPVPNSRAHDPDISDSLRALIGWGILTLGMLVAITTQQRHG